MWDRQNKPCRAPLARPDEPRHYAKPDPSPAQDGYHVIARRPAVDGYDDFVRPERARNIEDLVRQYDGPMMDYDD